MRRDALAVLSAMILALAGISGSEDAHAESYSKPLPQSAVVSVYFLDARGKSSPPKSIPPELTIELGAMPGKFGGVASVPLQEIRVGPKMSFQLDLAGLTAKLAATAARSNEGDAAALGQ